MGTRGKLRSVPLWRRFRDGKGVNLFWGTSFPPPGQGSRGLSDDDDMPRARPQFIRLSEAEVWKAIAEDAGGSVVAE